MTLCCPKKIFWTKQKTIILPPPCKLNGRSLNPEDLVGKKKISQNVTNVLKIMLFSGFLLKHRNLFLVSMGRPFLSFPFKKGRVPPPPIDRNKCLCSEVVIIHVNILSMHKNTCIQGLTPCLPRSLQVVFVF